MKFVTDRNDIQATAITLGVSAITFVILFAISSMWYNRLVPSQEQVQSQNQELVISQLIYVPKNNNVQELNTVQIQEANKPTIDEVKDEVLAENVNEVFPKNTNNMTTEVTKNYNVPPQKPKAEKNKTSPNNSKPKDLNNKSKSQNNSIKERDSKSKKQETITHQSSKAPPENLAITNESVAPSLNVTNANSTNGNQSESVESNAINNDKSKKEFSYTKVLKKVKSLVVYPIRAKRIGVQGIVKLSVTIDSLGKIVKTSIKKSSGSNILDGAAISIGQQLIGFEAEITGQEYTLVIPIAYELH